MWSFVKLWILRAKCVQPQAPSWQAVYMSEASSWKCFRCIFFSALLIWACSHLSLLYWCLHFSNRDLRKNLVALSILTLASQWSCIEQCSHIEWRLLFEYLIYSHTCNLLIFWLPKERNDSDPTLRCESHSAHIHCSDLLLIHCDVVQRSERLNEFKNHLSKSTMHCFLTTICNLQESSKRYESRHLQSTLIEGNERGSEQILNISSESLPTLSSPILSNHAFPDM